MLLNEKQVRRYAEQSLKELFIDSYEQRVKLIKHETKVIKSFYGAHNQIFGKELSFGFFLGGSKKEAQALTQNLKDLLKVSSSNEDILCETLNIFSGIFLRYIQMKDPTTIINIASYVEDTMIESHKWEECLEIDVFKDKTFKLIYFRI